MGSVISLLAGSNDKVSSELVPSLTLFLFLHFNKGVDLWSVISLVAPQIVTTKRLTKKYVPLLFKSISSFPEQTPSLT